MFSRNKKLFGKRAQHKRVASEASHLLDQYNAEVFSETQALLWQRLIMETNYRVEPAETSQERLLPAAGSATTIETIID